MRHGWRATCLAMGRWSTFCETDAPTTLAPPWTWHAASGNTTGSSRVARVARRGAPGRGTTCCTSRGSARSARACSSSTRSSARRGGAATLRSTARGPWSSSCRRAGGRRARRRRPRCRCAWCGTRSTTASRRQRRQPLQVRRVQIHQGRARHLLQLVRRSRKDVLDDVVDVEQPLLHEVHATEQEDQGGDLHGRRGGARGAASDSGTTRARAASSSAARRRCVRCRRAWGTRCVGTRRAAGAAPRR